MKEFFNKYKYKLLSLLVVLVTVIFISIISLLVLMKMGVIYYDNGINFNVELFDRFKYSWYGYFVIILIQVLITSLLSFIPGTSMGFIVLVQVLYNNPFIAFVMAFIGVMLSSFAMYLIGRFGGYTLVKKILGKEDAEKAFKLMNNKLAIYFPLMMLFPAFPDDALVMIAGTMKMKLRLFIPSIIVCRGIGIATIVFGIAIIPFDKFTSIWHWVIFITVCVIGVLAVFFATNRFNAFLEKRRKEKEDNK